VRRSSSQRSKQQQIVAQRTSGLGGGSVGPGPCISTTPRGRRLEMEENRQLPRGPRGGPGLDDRTWFKGAVGTPSCIPDRSVVLFHPHAKVGDRYGLLSKRSSKTGRTRVHGSYNGELYIGPRSETADSASSLRLAQGSRAATRVIRREYNLPEPQEQRGDEKDRDFGPNNGQYVVRRCSDPGLPR